MAYTPPQRLAVSGTRYLGIEHGAKRRPKFQMLVSESPYEIEQQRCEPLLRRTRFGVFVRFSVLLTITRDPCKLEGRNFERRWDISD